MNNKRVIMILTFLLLISSVNAFDLTSSETEKSVCPSSTILLNAYVFGTGSFNVNVEGSASKWTTFVPQGFTLNNEAKLIYIYVTPKFNTNPGLYDLNLVVTKENEIKNINYKINVPDCHNLIITGTESKNICGCNSDVYNFTISNNGIYQESYKIEVNGKAAPWIRLNQDTLTLLPGQSKTIYAFLETPCGGDFGKNDFTITIRSLTSNAVASFDSNVIVKSCFDFDAKVDREFINMCEHISEVVPIRIDNLADLDNVFDLKITGPAWANLYVTKLNLSSKSSGIINLVLSPGYRVEGDFDVDINIKSKQSKIEKNIKEKINVRRCNAVSFELLTREDKICVGSTKNYEANIKNTGEFEKDFRIETSYGWAKPEEVILRLKAGENKKINLKFSPSYNITTQKYKISFRALALDTSEISSEDSFNLEVISKEQCYKPEMETQDIEVNADSSAISKITIKNIGAELAVYELGLSGNANSFSQLNPGTITIEPGKSEIVYLYVAPPYNTKAGEYKADIFVNLKDLEILNSKTITIKVGAPKPVEITAQNKSISLSERLIQFFKKFEVNKLDKEEVIDLYNETVIDKNIKFSFEGKIHSLNILDVKNKSVTLSIESDPIFVILDLNETEEIDLDQDGKADLSLMLEGFKGNGAPLIKISKAFEQDKEDLVLQKQEISLNNLKDFLYKYKTQLLIAMVIIMGLIIFFSTKSHKKLMDYFEEESKGGEKEKPLKIGRYLILILVLIILFWYFRNYSLANLLNYLNTYKFYIIAGLIILIFLLLIIRYWKEIVNFFEEDIEEDKKRKKR